MGMDWHSSGVTTSVMGALKGPLIPHSQGIRHLYLWREREVSPDRAPDEIRSVCESTGLDGRVGTLQQA